jgi:hypothetical protein
MSMSMSINVNSLISVGLNKLIKSIVCEAIMNCGAVHNFDGSEMVREMMIDVNMSSSSSKKVLKEKVVKEKVVKEKVVKEKVVKEKVVKEKSKFPMPFNGSLKEGCCSALRQNHGLYTQCETVISESESGFESGFCKKCGPEPIYGTIEQRLEVGIMEFRDPKGKSPTPFTKVLKKLKISREYVEEEADRLNIKINEIHFQEEEKIEKKEKGRPKKPRRKIELADDSTDLFAALVARANEEEPEDEISDLSDDEKSSIAESIIDSVLDKVSVISENNEKKAEKAATKLAEKNEKEASKLAEKEAAKQALIEKKANELAEKEAAKQALIEKKANELAEKEAAKLALIEKKSNELAEKEAAKQALIEKKANELAEKEAAKLALIEKKSNELAEKEAAKQALIEKKSNELAEKEAAKQKKANELAEKEAAKQKKAKKEVSKSPGLSTIPEDCRMAPEVPVTKKVSKPVEKAAKAKIEVEEEEVQDVVKRFEFEGKKYLKSKNTGIIYNLDEEPIGQWNEKTSRIVFAQADSEEEEEEYDE